MSGEVWLWVGFTAFVILMLAIDLGVFHRRPHEVSTREAGIWTGVWVGLAIAFGIGIAVLEDSALALEYFTGYLIEKSLSVDNIFVFAVIFGYFRVPAHLQHRVLFWGILGALITRGLMIGAGVYLIARFEWILYVFGVFLVLTGIRLGMRDDPGVDPAKSRLVRLLDYFLPITDEYHGKKFFVRTEGRDAWWGRAATPLFMVLVMVEATDIMFAIDSIPAVFAVTRDPFIVFTSNIFAVLGLRAMYFLLAGTIERFHHLQYGLAAVLMFVGIKMLLEDAIEIPIWISLSVIAILIGGSVLWSLASDRAEGRLRASADARQDP